MTPAETAVPARLRAPRPATSPEMLVLTVSTALLVIGLVMNLSASDVPSINWYGSAFTLFGRQLVWASLAMVALVLCSRIDYRKLRGWTYVMLPAVWVLLIATLLPGIGTHVDGAQRWLTFGPVGIQPSEVAKVAVLLFGSDVLSRKLAMLDDWRHVVTPFLGAVGVTCLLILMQPDFGTMVIIAGSAVLLVYLAGARLKFLATLVALGVVVGVPVMLAEGYRRARFLGFLNSSEDALGAGWQSRQGMIGLGSGGIVGRGLGESAQKWGYLPNAHTDFIFAIVGEQTGLAGTLTILTLFGLLAVVGIRVARQASDAFGYLLAAGVTGWISLQAAVNIGTVTGVLPITGVPLPLISFGGSSLLTSLAALGLLASVARHSEPRCRRVARAPRPRLVPGPGSHDAPHGA